LLGAGLAFLGFRCDLRSFKLKQRLPDSQGRKRVVASVVQFVDLHLIQTKSGARFA
jgi:hypothetical protein